MSKQKNRQRFFSEHLDLILHSEPILEESIPPSPKIRLLELQTNDELEEICLDGDPEIMSKKTDFLMHFSSTTEEKSGDKVTGEIRKKAESCFLGNLVHSKKNRSQSFKGDDNHSIFSYLKTRRIKFN